MAGSIGRRASAGIPGAIDDGITELRKIRAEREVLEPPRELHEGRDVAGGRLAHQIFVIHCRILALEVPGIERRL